LTLPAATGALLYAYPGNFVAVPLMAAIAILVFAAGLFWPGEQAPQA
jgi:hypothetical protein